MQIEPGKSPPKQRIVLYPKDNQIMQVQNVITYMYVLLTKEKQNGERLQYVNVYLNVSLSHYD